MNPKITFQKASVLKPFPMDSRTLNPDICHSVAAGASLELKDYDDGPEGHIKVTLATPIQGRDLWFVWPEHCTVEGDEGSTGPAAAEEQRGASFTLPGYKSRFYLNDPIVEGGSFTWAEATKNGQRMPQTKNIVAEVLRIAEVIQDVRAMFGDRPILVTSWYRDPTTNRRVGGARKSRHLTGGAVDFKISGVSPSEVQRRLDPWWGSKGGLASASTFTHIDNRGYRARWRYGR
ncbi:MAG: D-Ala-D-Ala carboxypeptidase family metallohydrolase [Elainellaceae cyanobacterium]